jgi:dolichol-phosphate mannosyltransferase
MNVIVILPTYNERDTILVVLEQAMAALSSFKQHSFSYLVVDDSSPDGTGDVVAEFSKKHKNVHLLSGQKQGLGRALLRGMTYAIDKLDADILVQMDCDLSHDPKSLPKFIEALNNGADFVVGTRYIAGGSIPDNWGIHRKIFSIVGNTIVRFGLGFPRIHDWTGGYRAFYKKYFVDNKTKLEKYAGYVFQIAFLHHAVIQGATISEVPIHFTDRKYGKSKIAPSEYIRNVLLYVGQERLKALNKGPFKRFLVVGTIGFIINTVVLEVGVNMFGFDPSVGSALGAEFAIISNFILNNNWTFKEHKVTGVKQIGKFIQFNITSLGAIIIQAGTVFVGVHTFGIAWYRLYYIFGVALGLIWNYTMYSKVIWKNSSR